MLYDRVVADLKSSSHRDSFVLCRIVQASRRFGVVRDKRRHLLNLADVKEQLFKKINLC